MIASMVIREMNRIKRAPLDVRSIQRSQKGQNDLERDRLPLHYTTKGLEKQ